METKDVIGKIFVSQRSASESFDDYTEVTYRNDRFIEIKTCEEDGVEVDTVTLTYEIVGKYVYLKTEEGDWMKYKVDWLSSDEYIAISSDGTRELYAIKNSPSDRTSQK